jgi:hypothetical protein
VRGRFNFLWVTEERQRAGGFYVLENNSSLCHSWFKAPKFIYEKQKKYVFRDAQRKKYYIHIKSPKFIYGDYLLPPAFVLLPP